MAAIDDLLASTLITEITNKLSGLGSQSIVVPFRAFELASQYTPENETEITTVIAALATAKGWACTVYFLEQIVEIHG